MSSDALLFLAIVLYILSFVYHVLALASIIFYLTQ